MTQRIFVTVGRGITDKTAVCVFPWEVPILERIHADQVEEVSIEQMCSLKGAIKVEKNKTRIKRLDDSAKADEAPSLREQLEAMCRVDPEDDPAADAEAEYNRMVEKYGMDKEVSLPVVAVVFGQFNSGAFAAKVKESQPAARGQASGAPAGAGEKPPASMSINELRAELKRRQIDFDPKATKAELLDLLTTATA